MVLLLPSLAGSWQMLGTMDVNAAQFALASRVGSLLAEADRRELLVCREGCSEIPAKGRIPERILTW